METIQITFPVEIDSKDVKNIIEGNLKENSDFECICDFKEFDGEENVYEVSTEYGPMAFYYIGMTASGIIEFYKLKGII